jgi:hypothetical protein
MLITSRELMNCPSYNEYKYGLEKLYGYAETLSPQIIRTRLLTRPVMFVLGKADTDRDWGVTTDLIPCQKYQSNSPPKPSF